MNGSLCRRTHFVYRICVCSFMCLSAVGVDVIFQLHTVRSEGLGAQARQGRGCSYLESWCLWHLGTGDTSEGVDLHHPPLLSRKRLRELPKGSLRSGLGQGPSGRGAVALASLLLTTLPPAVLLGPQGPRRPEDSVYRLHPRAAPPFVGGSDAGPPLMGGWRLCIFFPLMGMALQNYPHPCLVPMIHVHKTATQEEGWGWSYVPGEPLATQRGWVFMRELLTQWPALKESRPPPPGPKAQG